MTSRAPPPTRAPSSRPRWRRRHRAPAAAHSANDEGGAADLYAEQERIQLARQEKKATEARTNPPSPRPPARRCPHRTRKNLPTRKPCGQSRQSATAFRADALARFQTIAAAEAGFVERLVQFWSNHFCIPPPRAAPFGPPPDASSARRSGRTCSAASPTCCAPSTSHPAMLVYLDNAQSFGPSSVAGERRKSGLNENLAREILELHTLGVGSGYTQADMTSLARILTGWTFAGREGRIAEPGLHLLSQRPRAGRPSPARQALQGRRHRAGRGRPRRSRPPSGHGQHVARKFAAHFVADKPPRSSSIGSPAHSRDRRRSEGAALTLLEFGRSSERRAHQGPLAQNS